MSWLLAAVEIVGMFLTALGYGLMAWALARLRRNYQLGGSDPRPADRLITDGPYRFIRHPMYTAAMSIGLGLACLTQSLAYLAVFFIYLVLVLPLIPVEEGSLRRAYGEPYTAYMQRTTRLIPFLY